MIRDPKQDKRQKAKLADPDGTDRPTGRSLCFAIPSRGLLDPADCQTQFLKTASQGLYESELEPMLKAYL